MRGGFLPRTQDSWNSKLFGALSRLSSLAPQQECFRVQELSAERGICFRWHFVAGSFGVRKLSRTCCLTKIVAQQQIPRSAKTKSFNNRARLRRSEG